MLTPHDEEKEGLDTLAVTEDTADGNSPGSRSTCISPASSQGGVYSVCSHSAQVYFVIEYEEAQKKPENNGRLLHPFLFCVCLCVYTNFILFFGLYISMICLVV